MKDLMKSQFIQMVLRFILSGGLSTALHWSLMAFLIHFELTSPEVATGSGAFAGAVLNYFLQYHFTFRTHRQHRTALPAYIVVVCIGWLLNLGVFWVLHSVFHIEPVFAQPVTTALVTVVNFILYKKVVFHEQAKS